MKRRQLVVSIGLLLFSFSPIPHQNMLLTAVVGVGADVASLFAVHLLQILTREGPNRLVQLEHAWDMMHQEVHVRREVRQRDVLTRASSALGLVEEAQKLLAQHRVLLYLRICRHGLKAMGEKRCRGESEIVFFAINR